MNSKKSKFLAKETLKYITELPKVSGIICTKFFWNWDVFMQHIEKENLLEVYLRGS